MNKMNDIKSKYTDVNNPGSFSGLSGFLKNNPQFKTNEVQKILLEESAFTLHKPLVQKFKRAKTIVFHIDECWQIDLIDVNNLKSKILAQWFAFLFTCIDVLSKFAFVVPIQNKTSAETCRAFRFIIENSQRKPIYVYSDNGREFLGEFKKYLADINVQHIFTRSQFKAAVVERFNRTLQEKMYRVFTYQQNKDYISVLKKLVNSYNNSFHSSIKMAPSQVNKINEKEVFNNIYECKTVECDFISFEFEIGSYVRKKIAKELFSKGYTPNWTKEIYIIDTQIPSLPPKYTLKTIEDKTIDGYYYKQELQKVLVEEFPFDSYIIRDSKNDLIAIEKLNSKTSEKVWVNKNSFLGKKLTEKEISNELYEQFSSVNDSKINFTRSSKKKMNIQLKSSSKLNFESNNSFTNILLKPIMVNMNQHKLGLKYISYSRFLITMYKIYLYGIKINENLNFGFKQDYELYRKALDEYKSNEEFQFLTEPINLKIKNIIRKIDLNTDLINYQELIELYKYSYSIRWKIGDIMIKDQTPTDLKDFIKVNKLKELFNISVNKTRIVIKSSSFIELLKTIDINIYFDSDENESLKQINEILEIKREPQNRQVIKRFDNNIVFIQVNSIYDDFNFEIKNNNFENDNILIQMQIKKRLISYNFNIICDLINNDFLPKQVIKSFRANQKLELKCSNPDFYKINRSQINSIKIEITDSAYNPVILEEEIVCELEIIRSE